MAGTIIDFDDLKKNPFSLDTGTIKRESREMKFADSMDAIDDIQYNIRMLGLKEFILVQTTGICSKEIQSAGLNPEDFTIYGKSAEDYINADFANGDKPLTIAFVSEDEQHNALYMAVAGIVMDGMDDDAESAGIRVLVKIFRQRSNADYEMYTDGKWENVNWEEVTGCSKTMLDILSKQDARAAFAYSLKQTCEFDSEEDFMDVLDTARPLYKVYSKTDSFMSVAWVFDDDGEPFPMLKPADERRNGMCITFQNGLYSVNAYIDGSNIITMSEGDADDDMFVEDFIVPAFRTDSVPGVIRAAKKMADRYTQNDVWTIPLSGSRYVDIPDIFNADDCQKAYQELKGHSSEDEMDVFLDVLKYCFETSPIE